jgi:hypothetical protein
VGGQVRHQPRALPSAMETCASRGGRPPLRLYAPPRRAPPAHLHELAARLPTTSLARSAMRRTSVVLLLRPTSARAVEREGVHRHLAEGVSSAPLPRIDAPTSASRLASDPHAGVGSGGLLQLAGSPHSGVVEKGWMTHGPRVW